MTTAITPDKAFIKEIDQDSVRFIAAGEKINDIETVIRELVENSIDAKAKIIEVRLTRFGVEAIDVEDDGTGIEENNFGSLGKRYHTSKVTDFTNVQKTLDTFGFRGEALSCLCNIANVTLTTKHKSSATGTRLVFKNDGTISKSDAIARCEGTTVIVKNLFHSMPVRRRELETSAKRQYDKVVKLLYEQSLARPDIKFSLCKKNAAKKEKDFTHGGTNLEGVIITIYGIKVFESLLPINTSKDLASLSSIKTDSTQANGTSTECISEVSVEDQDCDTSSVIPNMDSIKSSNLTEASSRDEFYRRACKSKFARLKPDYSFNGYISKIGCGRNSTDCQFLFVNRKPCDIPKLSKLINETYKNHSNIHFPFYCLFIQVQTWAADFNVPRKRAVILQEEHKLFNLVKETLEELFSPYAPASQKSCPVAHIPVASLKRQNGHIEKAKMPFKDEVEELERNEIEQEASLNDKPTTTDEKSENKNGSSPCQTPLPEENPDKSIQSPPILERHPITPDINLTYPNNSCNHLLQRTDDLVVSSIPDYFETPRKRLKQHIDELDSAKKDCTTVKDSSNPKNFETALEMLDRAHVSTSCSPIGAMPALPNSDTTKMPHLIETDCQYNEIHMIGGGVCKVRIDKVEELDLAIRREREQRRVNSDSKKYTYAIHPNFNNVAEEELKFNLSKTSFEKMQVLGQFNRGFIITKLNRHLFIIDQHATDERANYEDQLDNSPMEKQQMVIPKPLHLTCRQENAIINHIEEFKKRGFEFLLDSTKPNGLRVMLTSTSICKGHGMEEHLDKFDVEELIDVVLDSPNQLATYTLKKVRNVAASRACRKSVMIGDTLNWSQMSSIVSKMSTLQNPWICAHNRPTIRHLMDIDWMSE